MFNDRHYRLINSKLVETNSHGIPILRGRPALPSSSLVLPRGRLGTSEIPREVDLRLLPSERRNWI